MSIATRILAAIVVAVFSVGPVSAATVSNTGTMVAQAASSATAGAVKGTVTDESGAPVSGANVTIHGAQSYTATTDAKGAFQVANVAPALYLVTVRKAGYDVATLSDFAVFAGESQTLTVTLHSATFTALRTIATVRVAGHGTINTSTASTNVVPSAVYADEGTPQVTRVLNQVPGVQIAFPSTSGAQGSSPGAITFATIRGAAAFETASLIDGHPLSVGQYGDYVTTFLNSSVFGSTEVIKGPGAMSPQVNYAIGGTLNFRTKDPTPTVDPWYTFNITNHGGTFADLGLSDTVLNGRLGFVVDYARNYDQAAFNGQQVCFDPTGNTLSNGTKLNGWNGSNLKTTIPGTVSTLQTQFPLLACGETLTGDLDASSELLKLRYKLSGATIATVSYLGGQAYADQNANTGSLTALSQFAPGAGYTGGIAAGAYPEYFLHPGGPDRETNNEPILQAEVSTTLGNDTVLARFYHASIDRLVDEGDAGVKAVETLPLYGTNCTSVSKTNACTGAVSNFSGSPVAIAFNNYYRQAELDKLGGLSFQYTHPIGDNSLTFSLDQTRSSTTAYSISSFTSVGLPTGSNQKFTTAMLRGNFNLGLKTNAILSLYDNSYQSTYPVSCPFAFGFNTCAIDGSNVTFGTTTNGHFDGRLGLTYRPRADTSVRFAMGSAIAPPYLALLSQITTPFVTYNQAAGQVTQVVNNGGLKPETAFGYDIGADHIFKDGITTVSADFYLTNLFNHFFNQTFSTPYQCGVNFTCTVTGGGVAPPVGTPVLQSSNINLSNARFEGIELTLRHAPKVGFGWQLSGSTQKGYVYNLPPYFYCSNPGVGCAQNQNLNILPNQNFCGAGVAAGGLSTGTGNVCMPYLQGNAELSYHFKNGGFILGGETLYGKGNSLNEPPFGVGYLSIQYPISKTVAIQVSGDNIFNAWSSDFETYGGGVPVQLVNGTYAATSGNVFGPATWRFGIRKALGANPADFNNP